MYCVFCGNQAVANCPICNRRICGRHRRWWLTGSVCKDCRRKRVKWSAIGAVAAAVGGGLVLAIILGLMK